VSRDPGAAHNGTSEWYWQRMSAVVVLLLLPLPLLLLLGVYSGSLDQMGLLDLLDNFFSRLLHTLLVLALIVHGYLGMKIIFEDYLHHAPLRVLTISAMAVTLTACGLFWLALIWGWGG